MSTTQLSQQATATPKHENLVETSTFKRVDVSVLKAGAVLGYPVLDAQNTRLLAAGIEISDSFIERLKQREIQSVIIEQTDLARLKEYDTASSAPPDDQERAARCTECGQALPLHLPGSGEPCVTWGCAKCGARYQTTVDPEHYSELADAIRPLTVDVERANLQHPAEEITEFVHRLVEQPYRGPERRTSKRYPICIPVAALPVDEEFRPVGDPIVMMSRNISTAGIAMIHTRALKPKYLVLELSPRDSAPFQMVLEVLRCRPVGKFYEIAGKFLTRIDE